MALWLRGSLRCYLLTSGARRGQFTVLSHVTRDWLASRGPLKGGIGYVFCHRCVYIEIGKSLALIREMSSCLSRRRRFAYKEKCMLNVA